jgi:hypothetical protein
MQLLSAASFLPSAHDFTLSPQTLHGGLAPLHSMMTFQQGSLLKV